MDYNVLEAGLLTFSDTFTRTTASSSIREGNINPKL